MAPTKFEEFETGYTQSASSLNFKDGLLDIIKSIKNRVEKIYVKKLLDSIILPNLILVLFKRKL